MLLTFLRDSIWQFIGVIIAIIALFISIMLNRKQRSLKALTYDVISDTPILSINKEVAEKVQVLFNNKPVRDARLIIIRIWNSGNQPILSEDYDNNNPIRFDFGEKAEILDAEVVETKPSNIRTRVNFEQDLRHVALKPLLLNKKDSLTLKVLLTGYKGKINIDARIAGVKEVRILKKNGFFSVLFNTVQLLSAVLTILTFLGVGTTFFGWIVHNLPIFIFGVAVVLLTVLIIIVLYILLVGQFKRPETPEN